MEPSPSPTDNNAQLHYLQCLEMYPGAIRALHFDGKDIMAVARKGYSELYRISHHKDDIFFDELARLPECERLVVNQGKLALVGTSLVRMCDLQRWRNHSLSTAPLSITEKDGGFFTHHEAHTLRWDLEQLSYQLAPPRDVPYHIEKDGVRGYGKALKGQFTCCREFQGYLYLGDATGCLSIYETQYLTLVKQFKKHQAAILTIVGCEDTGCVYASGCDSRIICVRQLADNEFIVSSQGRGQSHDIYALCLLGPDVLVSGGVTTDLCYYELKNGNFTGKSTNRPSLPSSQLISSSQDQQLLLANHSSRFDLWKRVEDSLSLLVRFQVFAPLTETALSAEGRYLAYSNELQSTVVSIDRDTHELTKHMNLPPALYLHFPEKHKLILISLELQVLEVDLRKRQTLELFRIQGVLLPSTFQVLGDLILVASRLQEKLFVFKLPHGHLVQEFQRPFHFAQLHAKGLLVAGEFSLTLISSTGEEAFCRQFTIPIPLRKLRFGGDVPDRREYWLGLGDTKAVFVHRLFRNNNKLVEGKCVSKKSLRVRKVPAVYQLVPQSKQLTLVGIDFARMVNQLDNPVFAKKIL